MSTSVLIRGSTIYFSSTFFDVDNNQVTPASASIEIVYPTLTTLTAKTILAMAQQSDNSFKVQWDSRVAITGTVKWSVSTGGSPPYAVDQGDVTLLGNSANEW